MISLTHENGLFVCRCGFDERDVPKNAGFRWEPDRKFWWTRAVDKASTLSGYADDLCLKKIDSLHEAVDWSKKATSDLNIPAPEGLDYYPFQKAGIEFMRDRDAILLADSMGVGKTIQIIGLVNLVKDLKKVLIICPASLKLNWKRELETWLCRPMSISVISSGKVWVDADIVIINYDLLGKHYVDLRKQTWDLRVCDEAHFLRNLKAARTKSVFGKWSGKTKGWSIEPIPAKRRVLITGTPIVNRPIELWPLIRSLDPETWNSYTDYVYRYCAAKKTSWGFDVSGASNLKELGTKLRASGIFLRRLKEDVLKELPDMVRQVLEIEPDSETKKLIQKEATEWEEKQTKLSDLQKTVERSKARKDEDYAELVKQLKAAYKIAFEEMSKVRHDTAIRKLPAVISHIKGVLEEKNKVVVFAHHKDVVDALEEAFPESVSFVGSTPLKKRQDNVDKFQLDPKCKVFIGNILAAGVGITLTAADIAIFAEIDWVPSNISQAESRLSRIGQKNSVLIQHLVFEGSIDAKMAKAIVKKQNNINQVLKIT